MSIEVEVLKPKVSKISHVSDADIEKALRETEGFIYIAARALGLSGAAVTLRIKNSPYLTEVKNELFEYRLDKAEKKLLEMVDNGSWHAVTFFLRTQGKARGYVESASLMVAKPDDVARLQALDDFIKDSRTQVSHLKISDSKDTSESKS